MIDKRTRFFALSALLAFSMFFVAPENTFKEVPVGVGIVYVILTIVCGLESISRNSEKKSH